MKKVSAFVFSVLVGLSAPFSAAFADHPVHATGASLSEGLVRKVDRENGMITIRHGELKNLDMPPMTMAFRVKSASMLDQVKAGDRIRFKAKKVAGELVVTQIVVNE